MTCELCGNKSDECGLFKCSKCGKVVCCQCSGYKGIEIINAEKEGREPVGACLECLVEEWDK